MICAERDCRGTATHTRRAPWTATGVEKCCTPCADRLNRSLDRAVAQVEASRPTPIPPPDQPALWEDT